MPSGVPALEDETVIVGASAPGPEAPCAVCDPLLTPLTAVLGASGDLAKKKVRVGRRGGVGCMWSKGALDGPAGS
jgi:hypothetical protein